MSLDMYAEELIYNYEHPDSKGSMENASATKHEENVSCGDTITVFLNIENGKVIDAKFDGSGCIISMGAANMLMNYLKGKSIEEVERMTKEDLLKIINIDPGPARMHCATLSLKAVKEALFSYEKKPISTDTKEL